MPGSPSSSHHDILTMALLRLICTIIIVLSTYRRAPRTTSGIGVSAARHRDLSSVEQCVRQHLPSHTEHSPRGLHCHVCDEMPNHNMNREIAYSRGVQIRWV